MAVSPNKHVYPKNKTLPLIYFTMFSTMSFIAGQSTDGRGGRGATEEDDEDERGGGQRVQCGQA